MTKIIAEITDTGEVIVKETGSKRSHKDFMTAWQWFDKKKIPGIVSKKGTVNWNKMVKAINTEFNNKTIKGFVFQKFTEEYGSDIFE